MQEKNDFFLCAMTGVFLIKGILPVASSQVLGVTTCQNIKSALKRIKTVSEIILNKTSKFK
jgi:hypothetical protein